ncbi:DNA cytosine methyltransferase [Dyadobacter alkalitolerans]|uniref:DNA cytosine methyltransferase n=1 Tax=Dyadobacter alkalitolerans TaxID=492736 RepID=UPI0003FA3352|nr:DNA cytosine methyltransferase [Dyadobacter alkalitolerans]
MSKTLNYIDLFAGCGGLSLGLHKSGWKGIFAIEKSPDAFLTLRHNLIDKKGHFDWPAWLPMKNLEIDTVLTNYKAELTDLRGSVDLIVGGPPCQGFSSAGRRKENDVRNGLIKSYLRFIMHVRPKMIFFENVKGFTLKFEKNRSKGATYSEYVLRVLRFLGYQVEGRMVDFANYGLPQRRSRFILVGIRNDIGLSNDVVASSFFNEIFVKKEGFLTDKDLPLHPTLGNAISDLLMTNGLVETPDRKNFKTGIYSKPESRYQQFMRNEYDENIPDSHSFPKHSSTIHDRFNYLLQNKNGNKRIDDDTRSHLKISKHTTIPLSENMVAPTITTLPDDYIHYKEPRILTVREYARIQSFPDWFEFKGKYTTGGKVRTQQVPRYTQIGNAIPPLFAEQCGDILKGFLSYE